MINFNYYPDKKFSMTVFYGDVTPHELDNLADELLMIEYEGNGMLGISVLCSNVKPKGIKSADVINFGKKMQQATFRQDGKNAIVAKTAVAYGLARMYKVVSDVIMLDELKIYKKDGLADAIEWMGVQQMSKQIYELVEKGEKIKEKL